MQCIQQVCSMFCPIQPAIDHDDEMPLAAAGAIQSAPLTGNLRSNDLPDLHHIQPARFNAADQTALRAMPAQMRIPANGLRHIHSLDHLGRKVIPMLTCLSVDTSLKLHGRFWPAAQPAQATGVVNIVHGMGEHSGCYDTLAAELNKKNLHVIAFDQRGHGLSQGKAGVLHHYDHLHQELKAILTFSRAYMPNLPHSVYAHSMGGALMLDHLQRAANEPYLQNLQRIVVTGPWLKLCNPVPPVLAWIGWLANQIHRNLVIDMTIKVPPNPDRDPKVDKLCHGKISPNWYMNAEAAGRRVLANASEFPVQFRDKLVLAHSSDDQVTDPQATATFARLSNTKLHCMQGLGHSPHITTKRADFFDIITKYFDEPLPVSDQSVGLRTER